MTNENLENTARGVYVKSQSSEEWMQIREKISLFAAKTKRSFSNAMLILLQKGIEVWDKELKEENK